MSRMTSTWLSYPDYLSTIKRTWNSRSGRIIVEKLHYIKAHIEECESIHNSCRLFKVKLNNISIGYTRLIHGHLIIRNNQQPTDTNNQTLFPMGRNQKKIQYPEQYKNFNGKELWSGKDNEVS